MKRLGVFALLLALILIAFPAMAGGPNQTISTGTLQAAPPGYWTAERRARAKPKMPVRAEPTGQEPITASTPIEPATPHMAPGYNPGWEVTPAPAEAASDFEGVACPVSSYQWYYNTDQSSYPERVVGKIFFDDAYGNPMVCSGALIAPRLVLTAGHCAYDESGWSQNVQFVPAYWSGSRPYGTANKILVYYLTGWIPNLNWSYDLVLLQLDWAAGDQVGWLGFATGQSRYQQWVQYGYPAADPFDGSIMVVNISSWGRDDTSKGEPYPMGVGSAHKPGSSGGPWVLYKDEGIYANGVNSWYYFACNQNMYSPYFGDAAWDLYQYALERQ